MTDSGRFEKHLKRSFASLAFQGLRSRGAAAEGSRRRVSLRLHLSGRVSSGHAVRMVSLQGSRHISNVAGLVMRA